MTIEELQNKIFVFMEEERPPSIDDMSQWIDDIDDIGINMQDTIAELRNTQSNNEETINDLRFEIASLQDRIQDLNELIEEINR